MLWGVSCWPSGVPWGALGVAWAPLGASRWSFGVPLASFGVRWVSLGGPLVPQGGLLGGSWVAFWLPWCGLVCFLVALGVSRGFLWRLRGLARNQAATKEQSKRTRDTPTRTQYPLQNRASRSMTHRFLAPLVWPGAFFGGPRGFSRILVAFPRAGQRPSTKKRAVETQAGHTHTHATSFTKPRFPFHDSQVRAGACFARQVQYFRGVDLNKGTLVPEGSLGAFWGSFGSLLGCLGVPWGVSCWPSGVPWGALGVVSVPLGAPGCPLGGSRVAFGSLCCRLGRLLVALWCLEGSPEAQQYKKKPRFPFYVVTGL